MAVSNNYPHHSTRQAVEGQAIWSYSPNNNHVWWLDYEPFGRATIMKYGQQFKGYHAGKPVVISNDLRLAKQEVEAYVRFKNG